MSKVKREQVVLSIEKAREDPSCFLELVQQHHAKGESFDLGEFFQALPRKQHAQVWTALLLLTQSAVDTLSEMVGEDECKVGCPFFHGDQKMLCMLFQTKCAPPLSSEVVCL